MKKMLRLAAAFAALVAMTSFIACSNDDDDGDDSNKNGLENTYWTAEDISEDSTETVSITLKNAVYIHIEDSSKGTAYGADVESIDYDSLDYTTTNSVNIDYSSEKDTFTYVVDGSKITITSKYTDDDGKEQTETIEGTLASDKKSFTTTETDDGETVTTTYTRISNAPTNATLVITVAGSDSSETGGESGGSTSGSEEKINLTVDVTSLDFSEMTSGLTNTADSGKNGTFMIPASTKILDVLTPANDGKAFWYTDKALTKISALQLNAGGELNFTLSGAATVKVTFLSTGDANTSAITVNGTANSVTGKTAKEFTWEITEAGEYSIASTATSNARITAFSIVEK